MFKIGIMGTDNSHALAFAKLCNIPDENGNYNYDDVRITMACGLNDTKEHVMQVARDGNIETVVENPLDFMGKVDAVVITARHGSLHVPNILPFIEKGYPVWIDKPIASDTNDILKLKEAYDKYDALIAGGSTLRYATDVTEAATRIKDGFFGAIKGGSINYPADLESEYDGIYFYGSHIIEMMMVMFGYDIKSVLASSVSGGQTSVIAKYENFQVTLNMVYGSYEYFLTVIGDAKSYSLPLYAGKIYKYGLDKFVEMIKTKKMPVSFDNLVKPVYTLDAILTSLKEKREVEVKLPW